MSETLDPLSDRTCRMTHGYKTGIELTQALRDGADGQTVAVESESVHVESGGHSMQFLYVPSTSREGTTVFATKLQSPRR
nr:hypothetical protein [Halomicrobium katesii]